MGREFEAFSGLFSKNLVSSSTQALAVALQVQLRSQQFKRQVLSLAKIITTEESVRRINVNGSKGEKTSFLIL